jgi:hypothetical protein
MVPGLLILDPTNLKRLRYGIASRYSMGGKLETGKQIIPRHNIFISSSNQGYSIEHKQGI